MYVKEGRTILPCDTDSNFNQYCKFIYKTEKESLSFYLIYRPPTSSQENLEELTKLLQSKNKNSFYIGDFNLPDVDWMENLAPKRYQTLLDTCQEYGLEQMVDFPTHRKGNILDLVLTNSPDKVIITEDCGKIGSSDHSMIYIELNCTVQVHLNKEKRKNWGKANYNQMSADITSISWPEALTHLNTEQA